RTEWRRGPPRGTARLPPPLWPRRAAPTAARSGPRYQEHAEHDEADARPAGGRHRLGQEEKGQRGDHDVGEGGHRQDLADVVAGEQREVHEEERGLKDDAEDEPGVAHRAHDHATEQAGRRLGEITDRLHALRQQHVAGAAEEPRDEHEDDGLDHRDLPMASRIDFWTSVRLSSIGSSLSTNRIRSRLKTVRSIPTAVRVSETRRMLSCSLW